MLTLARSKGIGGAIKQSPEDFVVKEITGRGIVLEPNTQYDASILEIPKPLEGKYISFVLQKRDWNTIGALIEIAKKLGHGRKSIGYAGVKDKQAVTVQLASIFHPQEFDMGSVRLKDISINGFWRSDGVEMGSDLGNAFEVVIRDVQSMHAVEEVAIELNGSMPNYFGEQRFGDRQNNHKVGAALLQGDFESAVMEFLTRTDNERDEKASEARNRLAETLDFKAALSEFPRYLKGERTVLTHLTERPGNYANAVRLLPRGIALMFIHAVQSYIFNKELEERLKIGDFQTKTFFGKDFYGFPDAEKIGTEGIFPAAPLIGYETNDDEISEHARRAMDELHVSKDDFQMKHMKELNMKGSYRPLLAPVKDLTYDTRGENDLHMRFSLPKGSYATVLLNEFMKMD